MARSVSAQACRASSVIAQPRRSTSSSSARSAAVSPPLSRQHRLASGRPPWVTRVAVSKQAPSPARLAPRMRLPSAARAGRSDDSARRGAPGPQGAQFALLEAAREPFRRRRPALPREPRQGADRQHRREAVLAPLAAPAVRRRRERVAQRAQLRRRVAHRRRPARPLRAVDRIRQPRRGVRTQRTHEHLLRHRVRVRVRAVVPREPLRAAHPPPVRGRVADAAEPRRIHERLRELQRAPVRRAPVRAQPTQARPQRPRRQVPRPCRLRQDHEPRVVADQMQTPELHRTVPAQPAIPRRALERARLPTRQRQPVPAPHRDVPQPATRELPEPQIVVRRHQRVPPTPLVPARRTNLHLPQRHFRLVEHARHRPSHRASIDK